MTIDFDRIIDRRNTHSSKWDSMQASYGVSPDTGIPMWVADMDFRPPQQVDAALAAEMAHGVYGYYDNPASYAAALSGWMERRHNWRVDPSWLLQTHGLVNALALCISAFSNPGEGVIVFSPSTTGSAPLLTPMTGGLSNPSWCSGRVSTTWTLRRWRRS